MDSLRLQYDRLQGDGIPYLHGHKGLPIVPIVCHYLFFLDLHFNDTALVLNGINKYILTPLHAIVCRCFVCCWKHGQARCHTAHTLDHDSAIHSQL